MSSRALQPQPLLDTAPEPLDIRRAALAGLRAAQPSLPCSLFYDDVGAALFEQICEVPEYYPTRTEIGIMRRNVGEMAAVIGAGARVIELGSGSALKTRILLRRLHASEYVPIDISRRQLMQIGQAIAREFPHTRVRPVCADYTQPLQLPLFGPDVTRNVIFFPGSTIGNFEPAEAERFLRAMAHLAGPSGGLLIGVDLQKEKAQLEAAYNDAAGVTARFNLNILARLNRETGSDFVLSGFRHKAIYDEERQRIEMHLISSRSQEVTFPAVPDDARAVIRLDAGQSIVTEHSYKYSVAGFADLVERAGWRHQQCWVDAHQLFSVHWCTV